MNKEAAPSAAQISAAIGAALGIGSGTLANFILSKMMGYTGDWKTYVASGAVGGLAGGFGGAAAAGAVKKRIDYYRANPGELAEVLEKVEKSDALSKWKKFQQKSKLMLPVRRTLGKIFTNLKPPTNYDLQDVIKTYKDKGLAEIVKHIVRDTPIYKQDRLFYHDPYEPTTPQVGLAAADTLYRGFFDLPARPELFPRREEDPPGDANNLLISSRGNKTVTPNPNTGWGKALRDSFLQMLRDKKDYNILLGAVGKDEDSQGYRRLWDKWDVATSIKDSIDSGYYGKWGDKIQGKKDSGSPAAKLRILNALRNIADSAIGNPLTIEAIFSPTELRTAPTPQYSEKEEGATY